MGLAERRAAARVLASRWVAQGPEVEGFERDVCEYLGLESGHAVAVSSGTAALFLALWTLGAKDKRIAIPVYSCAAVRNAVLMAGGTPVPIDVSENSPNIDFNLAAAAKVDLIIAAPMFGIPIRLPRQRAAVPIVEDCSQAFGSRIDGRPVGVNGTVGVFSFYATKMITSGGQGGMLVSSEKQLIEAARDYREFDGRHDHMSRFNFQMTDLHAAIGRAQLTKLDALLRRRREIYARYRSAVLPLWQPAAPVGAEPCNYRAILRVADTNAMIARLEQSAVRAIIPIADWELLDDPRNHPRAAALARSTVSIPIYPSLTRSDIAAVIKGASETDLP